MEKILGEDRKVQPENASRNKLFKILDYYNAPVELYDFYKLIRPDEMITCGEYKFHTINDTVECYGDMTNSKKSFDVCYAYIGMGHVCALVYDPKVVRYYFRHDGGSNDWDVKENHEFFENKFNPRDKKYAKLMFTFEEIIQHILDGSTNEFMISEF